MAFEQYKKYFEELKHDEGYISYFIDEILIQLKRSPELAKMMIEEVIRIAVDRGYQNAYAEGLLYLGWYYHNCSQFVKAITYQLEALGIFKEASNIRGECKIYNAIISNYMEIGMIDLAIENGLKGIELARSQPRLTDLYFALIVNTTRAYLEFGQYEEILELLKHVEGINHKLSKIDEFTWRSNMAEAQIYTHQIESAFVNCQRMTELAKSMELGFVWGEVHGIRGRIHAYRGECEEAMAAFEQGIEAAGAYDQLVMQAEIYQHYGDYFMSKALYEKAIEKYQEGIDMTKKVDGKLRLQKMYKQLSKAYKMVEDYQAAYEALEQYNHYGEIIFNMRNSGMFAQLGNQHMRYKADTYKYLYERVSRISQIGKKLSMHLSRRKIIETFYEEANHIINTEVIGIGLVNHQDNTLVLEKISRDQQKKSHYTIGLDDAMSIGASCVREEREIFIGDLSAECKQIVSNIQSVMFCPLKVEQRILGVLTFQSKQKNAYDINDLNTIRILASYVGIALYNAHIFQEMNYLAKYDSLTGTLNRREILAKGETYQKCCQETNEPMSLIMMDIDYFKQVNDTYGHDVGDLVLKETIKIVEERLENEAIIGRYGGEEFIILLKGKSKEAARMVAEYLRQTIESWQYTLEDGRVIQVTSSFGVYEYEGKDISFDQGLRRVDQALYAAKDLGRNCVYCHK